MIAALRQAGHRVEVCRSFEAARHAIEQYLALPPTNLNPRATP